MCWPTARDEGLPLRVGIELDWLGATHVDALRALVADRDLDIVLGSVHWLAGEMVDHPDYPIWQTHSVAEVWRLYFEQLRAAASSGLYDVMAHPDLPKVFGQRPPGGVPQQRVRRHGRCVRRGGSRVRDLDGGAAQAGGRAVSGPGLPARVCRSRRADHARRRRTPRRGRRSRPRARRASGGGCRVPHGDGVPRAASPARSRSDELSRRNRVRRAPPGRGASAGARRRHDRARAGARRSLRRRCRVPRADRCRARRIGARRHRRPVPSGRSPLRRRREHRAARPAHGRRSRRRDTSSSTAMRWWSLRHPGSHRIAPRCANGSRSRSDAGSTRCPCGRPARTAWGSRGAAMAWRARPSPSCGSGNDPVTPTGVR